MAGCVVELGEGEAGGEGDWIGGSDVIDGGFVGCCRGGGVLRETIEQCVYAVGSGVGCVLWLLLLLHGCWLLLTAAGALMW